MGRLLAWLGAVLVTVTLAAASTAQDEPPGPAFGSTYRYQFTPDLGRSINFCASQLATLRNNRPAHSLVLDLLSNPFLPPLDTPVNRFQAPPGWVWRPEQGDWSVYSSRAIELAQEYCFGVPVTRAMQRGEVAQIVAEAQNGDDLYFFTSQQVVPKAKRGDLPLVYTLPQQDVTGTFTSPSSACGLARNFTTGLRISAKNNLGMIEEPRTGDTVKGTVNPKTYTFKFTGSTEVYAGGIKDLVFWASYGYTRIFGGQPCTAGYLARIDLIKEAQLAPACSKPRITVPRTTIVRSGSFVIRIGSTCAGQPFAGLKVTATAHGGNEAIRVGNFVTKATSTRFRARSARLQRVLFGRRERALRRGTLELRSGRQMGLRPGRTLADILFPEQ